MFRMIASSAVVSFVLVTTGCSGLSNPFGGGSDRSGRRSSSTSGDYRTSPSPGSTSPTTSQDRMEQRDRMERMERERAIGSGTTTVPSTR